MSPPCGQQIAHRKSVKGHACSALSTAGLTASPRPAAGDSVVWRAMQRTLVVLLANHTDGDVVRASDIAQVAQRNSTGVDHAVEILHLMGIVIDDRPRTFDLWLHAKLVELTPTLRRDVETCARVLHDGGPRTPARSPGTATIYVNAVRPVLLRWQTRYRHLREVTRDDIIA